MPERSAIVAEARAWVGTPFHWQASAKGKGCDCKGLIAGVARDLGLPEAGMLYARMADYARVDPAILREGLRATFDQVAEPEPGDVLLLKVSNRPQHLAIYVGEGRMIHTYSKGPGAVVEVPMGQVWRDAIDSVWSWR